MPIKTETFDVPTAPATPSGWTWDSGIVTTTSPGGSLSPVSSPNVLSCGPGLSLLFGTYGTPDTNGGDVTLSCYVSSDGAGSHKSIAALLARGSSSTLDATSTSWYAGFLDLHNRLVSLQKSVSGTITTLTALSSVSIAIDTWYLLIFETQGTTLKLSLQRVSDGHWLNPSGTFGPLTAVAITQTDTSVTGAGYGGLYGTTDGGSAQTYFDTWVFDVASIATSASFGVTDNPDTAAISAKFGPAGSFGVTDRPDTALITSSVVHAIITKQDNADVATIVAKWTASATFAVTDNRDASVAFGDFRAATVAVTDHRDTAAITAIFASPAHFSVADHGDVATISGQWQTSPIFSVIDARDTAAISAKFGIPGHFAVTDNPDVASITATTAVVATPFVVDNRDIANFHGVAYGAPPSISVTDNPDIASMFGTITTLVYDVYANGGMGDPIDYNTPIWTTAMTTYTTVPLFVPGIWKFGVRAQNSFGIEQNIDAQVTIILDASGNDITNLPNPPTNLKVFATAGGGIRTEWWFPLASGPKAPTGFHVYISPAPTLSYASPVGTVSYASGIQNTFRFNSSGYSDGVTYVVGVRAFNAVSEEKNTSVVSVVAESVGPTGVIGLTARSVV